MVLNECRINGENSLSMRWEYSVDDKASREALRRLDKPVHPLKCFWEEIQHRHRKYMGNPTQRVIRDLAVLPVVKKNDKLFCHNLLMHRNGLHFQNSNFAPWHYLSAPW